MCGARGEGFLVIHLSFVGVVARHIHINIRMLPAHGTNGMLVEVQRCRQPFAQECSSPACQCRVLSPLSTQCLYSLRMPLKPAAAGGRLLRYGGLCVSALGDWLQPSHLLMAPQNMCCSLPTVLAALKRRLVCCSPIADSSAGTQHRQRVR